MLALLATALFAASATGQLTTALWMFSSSNFKNNTNVSSIVDSNLDRTTVAFIVVGSTNTKSNTMTLGGLTYVECTATPSVTGRKTATIVVACSRANEQMDNAACIQPQLCTESEVSAYYGSFSGGAMQTAGDFRQGMLE
jgi:hypothetical protein